MARLLELAGISKVYGNGIYANRNVNFSVEEGEIHALVGENGAGKSTLMKVIYGLEQPDMGEIRLRGARVRFHSPEDAMRQGVGMVHQHFMLVESMSVVENVTLGLEPSRLGFIDRAQARERVREFARIFDLEGDLNARVSDLPVGIKQKVEIVKAMYRGAKILILDEPTAVLTPQETAELFDKLKQLKTRGYTVIFISHKLREIMDLCDRVSIMRRGELVETARVADTSQQRISEKMVGAQYSERLDKEPADPGEVLLRTRDVVYVDKFGKRSVDGVSIAVRAGEIVGVAGVEGNGQNELVEMIFALKQPFCGSVEIMGRNIHGMSVRALRSLGTAYVPADRMTLGLAKTMSIEENLLTTKLDDPSMYRAGLIDSRRVRAMAEGLVDEFRVKCTSPATEVEMLSGGNMQKVVVAREFTQHARLYVVEQPTRGIDVGAARLVHEQLLRLRAAGCAILLVSADLDELFKLSDSLLVMYSGRVSAYFERATDVSETEIGHYMLGVKRQSDGEVGRAAHE
ncbi:MAG: ABC transporter ATP-binding protein [Christensenellaceae bacterium]|nr:ABC transporter ATP-binding protein [Christensenellaceae bacterium]